MNWKFRGLVGLALCVAACEPIADADFIAVAYAGKEIPARARLVARSEYLIAPGRKPAQLGVVQAGGREHLVIVERDYDGASGEKIWRRLLALEFSAPRVIASPIARELPPGLTSARVFYTGDPLSAVRRVALVKQIGRPGDAADTLFVEYAREQQPGYFLYTPAQVGTGFDRSYDNVFGALPAKSFLYFNGFETVVCDPGGGACPAFEFTWITAAPAYHQSGVPDETNESIGFQLRIRNFAPVPAPFRIAIAPADPKSRLRHEIARDDSPADVCTEATDLIRCRIDADVRINFNVSNVTPDNPALVRLSAESSTGRALAPPVSSLRRTIDGPGGSRMYLANFHSR